MVAEGHHVDPVMQELVEDLRRQPAAAGGVLAVTDDQVQVLVGDQVRQPLGHDAAPGLPDDVPDTENIHGHVLSRFPTAPIGIV